MNVFNQCLNQSACKIVTDASEGKIGTWSTTIVTFKRVPNHRRLLIIDDKTFMSLPNKQRHASTRLAKLKV